MNEQIAFSGSPKWERLGASLAEIEARRRGLTVEPETVSVKLKGGGLK